VSDLARFRQLVESRLGLSHEALPDERLSQVLEHRLRAAGCADFAGYQARLGAARVAAEETAALAEQLTVGETYFFREPRQIDAFVEIVLPTLIQKRGGQPVRVLSAGCATGEEAYSLAIAIAERLPGLAASQLEILGLDVNPAAIRKARKAQYSAWAFRAAPPGVRERSFIDVGIDAELRRGLRQKVNFEERNLLDQDPEFWKEGAFDAIFCRNVLIYLSRPKMIAVIDRLTRSLAHGGYLFLGHSETLRGISDAFETVHDHDAFYYRRRGDTRATIASAFTDLTPRPPLPEGKAEGGIGVTRRADPLSPGPYPPISGERGAPALDPAVLPSPRNRGEGPGLGGFSAIARGRPMDGEGEVCHPSPGPTPRPAIAAALSLFKQERFAEAMATLKAESAGEADAEVSLLVAVILSHQGRTREAARLCAEVLEESGADAGAHYLLGLCREDEGDYRAATRHYRAAIQTDRSFAMPHMRLGLLARRAGDATTAWTETRRAAELLPHEREGRVLLFAGGFQREALVELCHAELRCFGGKR
jgi:chemotaxis protein methyltransferase CheR